MGTIGKIETLLFSLVTLKKHQQSLLVLNQTTANLIWHWQWSHILMTMKSYPVDYDFITACVGILFMIRHIITTVLPSQWIRVTLTCDCKIILIKIVSSFERLSYGTSSTKWQKIISIKVRWKILHQMKKIIPKSCKWQGTCTSGWPCQSRTNVKRYMPEH